MKRLLSMLLCAAIFLSLAVPAAAAPQDEAQSLVKKMSLEQRIAQMVMPSFSNLELMKQAVKTYGFGGVIFFADNITGTASTAAAIHALQQEAQVPLLVAVDQEGGSVSRLKTGTSLCGNMALGATGDPQLAKQAASIIGSELSAMGFNLDFAPDMDVNNNPANPIIGLRSFSDDAETAAKFGTAYLEGLRQENVAATLKHFPGHGDTATDSHTGLPCIYKTLAELRKCELIPFAAGVKAGADVVMTAHIQYPQIENATYTSKSTGKSITLPATLSKIMVTDVLRGELGFEGVVSTDAMNMDAIATHFAPMDAARLAINAGVDLLLMPLTISSQSDLNRCKTYIDGIAAMVKNGSIAEDRINQSAERILRLKINRGILQEQPGKQEMIDRALAVTGSRANHDAEWDITQKAVTLVKNDNMLPVTLGKNGSAVLFCPYANEVNSMNYGVSRLKQNGLIPSSADCQVYCYRNDTYGKYTAAVQKADAVIVAVETYRSANMNAASDSGWQAAFTDGVIETAHKYGKKVCVISTQLPYDLARYQKADALLAAYGSDGMPAVPTAFGGETQTYGPNIPVAVYGVFGGFVPSGALPVNIPQVDSKGTYQSSIMYSRGFGLTNWGAEIRFSDVPKDSYYADAVAWAVERGITKGTGGTQFSPNRSITRGEVVTFLHRMAGEPEAKQPAKFSDVSQTAFYAKAVAWAVEQGITKGVGGNRFSPNETCTRAQCVTFLARFAGADAGGGKTGFSDVPENAYFAPPVAWAVRNEITNGTGNGKFSPQQVCTRCQVVTFLWRLSSKD